MFMTISRSFWRKAVATVLAAFAMVFFYETTIRDSRYAARQAIFAEAASTAQPGTQLQFTATAYCKGETTASGARVRTGIAAADPLLLPVGTVVRIDAPVEKYSGIWTIMDTGPAVQGRILDLYLWSCKEALQFGRRPVKLTVLRLGWNPQNSAPSVVDTLFRQRERARAVAPLPSKPLEQTVPFALPPAS
ncbi:MAG: 3D domain-containing protein [Vicinamibacterales bacterium]